jgi:hypothetical protein
MKSATEQFLSITVRLQQLGKDTEQALAQASAEGLPLPDDLTYYFLDYLDRTTGTAEAWLRMATATSRTQN